MLGLGNLFHKATQEPYQFFFIDTRAKTAEQDNLRQMLITYLRRR